MAARATVKAENALVQRFTVKAATTATAGLKCKFGGSDTEVEVCAAGEAGSGWFKTSAAAGENVDVWLDGFAIIPVTVGTGGATRGALAIFAAAADGMTDKTVGGGSTVAHVTGRFMNSGSATHTVGLLIGASISSVSA